MTQILETDYVLVDIDKLTEPREGMGQAFVDRWWLVAEGEKLPFFKGRSPACNSTRAIVERLALHVPFQYEIRLIKTVFVSVRLFERHGVDDYGEPYSEMEWEYILPEDEA